MFLKRMMNVSTVLRKIGIRALPDLEVGGGRGGYLLARKI